MKCMVLTMALAMAGGAALAQTASMVRAEAAPGAPMPSNPAASGILSAPVAPAAPATGMTTDTSKQQELLMELRKVQQELRPFEGGLEQDPDIKEIGEKINEARQHFAELQKQRMEMIDAKLATNPQAAPLVAKFKELRAKAQEMMKTANPNGMPQGMMGGMDGRPGMMPSRPMPPMRAPDATIVPPPPPKPAPAPAAAPAPADKTAVPADKTAAPAN